MTDEPQTRPRRTLLRLLAVAGVVVLVIVALTWLNRRTLAREALTGWLESRGIATRAVVEEIGPSTFTARLSLGDPSNPDFEAQQVDVRYRARLSGLEVVSVTLRKPVLRARLTPAGLKMGSLDPLVTEFLSRPPPPGAKIPRINIDDGVLVLGTDYGPARVTADALVDDGQLKTLTATSAPTRLKSRDFDVALGAGALTEVTRSGRADVLFSAPVTRATAGGATLSDARLTFTAQLPYPDVQKRRGEGAVVANLTVVGARADVVGQTLEKAELKVGFTGQSRGWIGDLAVRGQMAGSFNAGSGRFGEARAEAIRAAITSKDLAWTRAGGDRLAGVVTLSGAAQEIRAADLRLTDFVVAATGPVSVGASGGTAELTGSVVGHGAWSGMGAPVAGDAGSVLALKRAARGFRIAAPRLGLTASYDRQQPPSWSLAMREPVRLTSDSGARLVMTSAQRLSASGGGLPKMDLTISRLQLGEAPSADVALAVSGLSAGPAVNARLGAAGRVAMADGGITFTASRCADFAVQRLEFGANDIEAISGRLCRAGGPLFAMRNGAWRVSGRAERVAAAAPFVQGRVAGGAGRVRASGSGPNMTATIHADTARLEDTAPETRFNPFLMSGDVTLREFIWRADLAFMRPDAGRLGTALVTHDGRLGFGVAVIETETLTFAEGGLQPLQISPLASSVGSPAVGQARFTGRFDWAPEGSTSSGKLIVPGLDFQSPAGPVRGLKGEIVFESLAPLKAAPGQELTVAEVQSMVLLTGLRARFELADNLLKVEGGEASVGGGRIRAETLEVPLAPGAPTRGVIYVEGVQLHDLVEASPFGDKVDLDAKVSGRIPFEMTGNKVRISGGLLKADQPGRLSISRAALTGVSADTPTTLPSEVNPNDTFTDFAYQAMENLAFDTLEVTVASKDDGRLGMLFHIVGRHDPPTKQRIRLTLLELIQRKFLGRKLPLPSGTGVNLTLDTTLNLDDLMADWGEFQRARTPQAPKP
ncbi:intermembrane phospholipid transport protein YdbH family protein [Phenylobacterium sp.]|uniref:intermembrane phospholipid transport protein YdbH family protein n=1 Tax=Phenylobacterium sp. TaxID=1871053 RepID=UPI003BAC9BF6